MGGASSQTNNAKRRVDRFKPRENVSQADKVVKQNDLIIKLLREIRDRLPEPPISETPAPASNEFIPKTEAAPRFEKKPKPSHKQSVYRYEEGANEQIPEEDIQPFGNEVVAEVADNAGNEAGPRVEISADEENDEIHNS